MECRAGEARLPSLRRGRRLANRLASVVESQISQVDEVKSELDSHQQALVALEKELGELRE